MCGIAGCYYSNQPIDKSRFEEMIDMIAYRGPNDRGVFYDEKLAFGHRRLAIIDLSTDGHQPFFYQERYVLVFNGEIYNYIELREILKNKEYQFKTETDTEVLIAAYDCFGEKCVQYFNGMWSFAIYDRKESVVFCSRDRFGVKPFYYYFQNGAFIFGSEIKQIIHMVDRQFSVNRPRLLEYLIRGIHDHTDETMVSDVMQLRGGHNLTLNLNKLEMNVSRYYNLKKTAKSSNNFDDAKVTFYNRFRDSVKLRLRADVPVGYCLSGGLDSSSIVCMADKIIKENSIDIKQESVSSCFDDKRYDEQEYIDEVLNKTNVKGNKVFPDGESVLKVLDTMLWHMDEPFSSTSMYAQWNVFKAAKECNLTVMLDGQGADEQLAGYTGFYSVVMADCLRRFQFGRFVHELKSYKAKRAINEKYVKSYKIIIEALISAYLPRKVQQFGKIHMFYLKQGLPFEPDDIKKTLYGIRLYPANDYKQYILDNLDCNLAMLLHYEDRNSMAHSIESRVPFLDYQLAEVMFGMPIDYKLRDGITKYIMRESLSEVLPEKIKNRYSKLGFVTPEDQWINENPNAFRREVEEACDVLTPLLHKDRVMRWYNQIEGKVQRRDFTLWHIICASHWIKVFNLKV